MSDLVVRYFSERAGSWRKHYRPGEVAFRAFDAVFRRGLEYRWRITMKHALPAQERTYLDIGCGSGDYAVALAREGAAQVIGIDIAPAMIELSRRAATEQCVQDRCQFILGDFANLELPGHFDVVLAIGVFDYVKDYASFWSRMVSVSEGIVIASFPAHSLLREPIRRIRYRWKGLPVYFYSREQLETLGRVPGLTRFTVQPYPAGLALIGSVS